MRRRAGAGGSWTARRSRRGCSAAAHWNRCSFRWGRGDGRTAAAWPLTVWGSQIYNSPLLGPIWRYSGGCPMAHLSQAVQPWASAALALASVLLCFCVADARRGQGRSFAPTNTSRPGCRLIREGAYTKWWVSPTPLPSSHVSDQTRSLRRRSFAPAKLPTRPQGRASGVSFRSPSTRPGRGSLQMGHHSVVPSGATRVGVPSGGPTAPGRLPL